MNWVVYPSLKWLQSTRWKLKHLTYAIEENMFRANEAKPKIQSRFHLFSRVFPKNVRWIFRILSGINAARDYFAEFMIWKIIIRISVGFTHKCYERNIRNGLSLPLWSYQKNLFYTYINKKTIKQQNILRGCRIYHTLLRLRSQNMHGAFLHTKH